MRTKLFLDSTNKLISEIVETTKPIQETTEVVNALLDGSWHVQTVGSPRHSFDLEFYVDGNETDNINSYAAAKNRLRLVRHGKTYYGIISGNPAWDQVVKAPQPERARYRCRILLLVTEG